MSRNFPARCRRPQTQIIPQRKKSSRVEPFHASIPHVFSEAMNQRISEVELKNGDKLTLSGNCNVELTVRLL